MAIEEQESGGAAGDWTPTESSIRAVFATLSSSDIRRIRRDTTLYQLGLDSISAVLIASALRKLGHQVLASDVIEYPTCESLARYLDSGARDKDIGAGYDVRGFQDEVKHQVLAHGIRTASVEAVLPCTPLQSAMMAQFIKSGGRDYFNYVSFEMEHNVSAAKLAGAWRALCLAHPILRTGILPIEHRDCAFAMVQYRTHAFAPALTVVNRGTADTFRLETWRAGVSRAVKNAPHQGLWGLAVVEEAERTTMHLTIHHALYDARSLRLLLNDLSAAAAGGLVSSATRTEDAVADILGQVTSGTERSAEFWKKQADKVVINGFPLMTPLRQPSRDILTESVTSNTAVPVLENAASASGYTMQVILQAAWTRVLSAYLGEDSVVFGVVFSGRNTDATRGAVFPCLTTLPVIATNSDSNSSLLAQMLRYNTELYKHQHQPLTRIQQWLGYPESRLFDTLLVYQKLDLDSSQKHWRMVDDRATVDYPVSIEVEPCAGNRLEYRITFFSDVLAKEQALLLLKQLDAEVQHLALVPDGSHADLFKSNPHLFSVLPPETLEIPTAVEFLHEFVELQASKAPNATALYFVDRFDGDVPVGRKWTYEELDRNGNRVAQMLLPHVRPGDIVAVCFDKCPAAYFSILGILKAGCAFVALDPGAPRARNEFIVKDSGATVLLVPSRGDGTPELTVSVPVLAVDENALSSIPAVRPDLKRAIRPSDVCYCLYTSGTTGTPKGCEITHDNAVQCMLAFQHIFRGHWTEDSRWLQFASLHFDVSVLEQYWSWSVGITLVAAPRDLILEDLAGAIARLEITHIDLTPSLARLLHPDDVPSLCRGVFITGGESLKQEILDVWGSKRVIYNFYGPTEATIGVTVFPRVPTDGRPSNIGRQFINVGSYVLKPGTEQPVLRGAVGELCVSGRLVGKGYLGRDDLTAEKFPTLQHFGERVYRTGDLVRVLHDGCFDFLGRADDQVKLRGQRLEIGEINHAIRNAADAIKDVATLVVRNEAQQKDLLVSFIVAGDGWGGRGKSSRLELVESLEASELCRRARDACRSRLPGYMVPTYVLQVPFIPLSANNKAEIKELRKFFASLGQDKLVSLSSAARSHRTFDKTGARIAGVLGSMQAIDVGSITPDSSIFELGVDSISVLRFARALKSDGFAQATPSLILRHPLVGDLARALEQQTVAPNLEGLAAARQLIQACAHRHRSSVCRDLGLAPDQIEYIAPCSPLQQGMISRSEMESAYFNTLRFVLAPDVSAERLREAYQRAMVVLPILRTRFVSTPDGFVQVAVRESALPWSEIQLDRGQSADEVVRETRDAWIGKNQGTFYRPWEAVLIEGGKPDGRLLILHVFHGLYDANSLRLLLDGVATEYLALTGSRGATTFTPGPSFLDALCYGPLRDFDKSRPFWTEHLDGANLQSISSHPAGAVVSTSQRHISFERLEALRTTLGVTHQALVQAAWVSVLSKHLCADPTIGIIVSGRAIELDGAERVIGPLFNTLPFHVRIAGRDEEAATTWASLVRQCHDFNTTVLEFQHTPLRDIQKWCSAGRPLFDTLFTFQRDDVVRPEHMGLWTVVDSEPNLDYPLALEATLDSDGRLHLLAVARHDGSRSLFSMMEELEEAFGAMVENPDNCVWQQERASALEGLESWIGHNSATMTTNGDTGVPDSTPSLFSWTEEAMVIRDEVAGLADTEPESITETTPMLRLGLDSIDFIKLSARLKRRGIAIKSSELMKYQTIKAILEHLHAQVRSANGEVEGSSKERRIAETKSALQEYVARLGELEDGEIVLPTTPLQGSMLVEMVESDFQLYFNHDILKIAPSVDIERLKDAWQTVVSNSPILRTRFLPVDSVLSNLAYCQVVGTSSTCYIGDVALDNEDELAKICERATLRARQGAGRSGLIQLVFARVGDHRYLVISMAHALYDGWSLGLLHQQVQAAYQGRYAPCSLESYLGSLGDILFPDHSDAHSFWSGYLQGSTPTIFPKHESDGDVNAVHKAELTSSLAAAEIASFCKANAVTLQTLGQACWAAVLAATTGSLDVTFGVVLSCRDTEALEKLVFPTMNTVAVRSVLHGTVSSWLRYMQENTANMAPHQHFPLREAQKLAQARGPLFNTLFIQQRELSPAGQQAQEGWMRSVGGSSAVDYPVCVEMEMSGSKLVLRTACSGAYVSQEGAVSLLGKLDGVLRRFVTSPDADVLAFTGQDVIICGLPPVVLKSVDGRPKSPTTGAINGSEAWSPLEASIRDTLAEVSGTPAAAILKSNNVYHLGLDSISAIRAGSLLRKRGIGLAFRDMLRAESIAEMAQLVRGAQPVSHDATTDEGRSRNGVEISADVELPAVLRQLGVDKSAVEQVLPASPMQVHMLSVWQNTGGEVFYPEFRYSLRGSIDITAINAAWNALVAETPVLRTVFASTSSRSVPIVQVVLHPSSLGPSRASVDSDTWDSKEETGTPSQPYHRLRAEKDGEDGWRLRLNIHHALYDAVSLPAIMERFAALCGGDRSSEAASPAFSWRAVLAPYLSEHNRAARKRFWTEYLAGAPAPSLCLENQQQESACGKSRVGLVKPAAVQGVSGLVELCKKKGISLQALFFSAYAEFVASLAAERAGKRPESVVFGVYLANRTEVNEPGARFYPFLRLVPIRVLLREGWSVVDAAVEVQRDIHAVSSAVNVEVGLWEIKDWTGITVDSFVNFLQASAPVDGAEQGNVRLEVLEDVEILSGESREMTSEKADGETLYTGIDNNPVRDAYPVSVPYSGRATEPTC